MLLSRRILPMPASIVALAVAATAVLCSSMRADVTGEEVERAIKAGVGFLRSQQKADGSWTDADAEAYTGTTSLVTLALLAAGESPDERPIAAALDYLRKFAVPELKNTYAVALQTMVFAVADPVTDRDRIAANARWLENAQFKPRAVIGRRSINAWRGSWTYSALKARTGDNSNTQYALLGLHAAREAGATVDPAVWDLSRDYWERSQCRDGGWSYTAGDAGPLSTGSMTFARIASLLITRAMGSLGRESYQRGGVLGCGKEANDAGLRGGLDWIARRFTVNANSGAGQQWTYYGLYAMERAGRLSGQRLFGNHDWFHEGARVLVNDQDPVLGSWQGAGPVEGQEPLATTSFALLFLAKGRSPLLVHKLRHGPGEDWNNDPADLHNLVVSISREWKHLLTWQVAEPDTPIVDLQRAPVLFVNGHKAPVLTEVTKKNLRQYLERGGFILAEACCEKSEFDAGFRALIKELFPDPKNELHPLAADHAIWNSGQPADPKVHPLWGLDHGGRTAVVYSATDLSCSWNLAGSRSDHAAVVEALRVGHSIVNYATGGKLPAYKLSTIAPPPPER